MQESIMSAETLEEGDANALNLINSLVTAEEEQQLQHHHAHHQHHDFTELTDNHFLGDHHSATTPTLSDSKIHHDNEIHSVTDEEHLFNFNLGSGTTPTNQPHRDDDSSSHHLVGNFDSTTSTPIVQTNTGQPLDDRDRLLKRINELEEQVRALIEDNKQKTDAFNVITQHNIDLSYQLQIIQYYHPELISAIPPPSAANPTPNSPLMLSPNNHHQQHIATTSPFFSNPTGITPSSHFSTSPGVLSNITSPMTSPSANTPNMSNNINGISPNLQPSLVPNNPAGYYPLHHPHLMQPTPLIPQQPKNGTKKKKKKGESPAVNSSSFQSPISSVTSPTSSVPLNKKQTKKKRKHESDGEETSESEDETPENATSTPSNLPPVNTHLPPPPSSNLPPKPKVTLPPQPSKHLPKLPPRSLLPGMDPFAMHATTPFPFPPPSGLPHPPLGMSEHPLMMDPSLLQHHMAHHSSEAPSPGAFSPMGTTAETPGASNQRRRSKKGEGIENSDSSETLNPSNAELEIRKLFGKVNNGGKRGILAVHAGDGLEAVKEIIRQTLDQVELLKNRSVTEYNSRKENNAMNCINKALDLLHQATRGIVGGLLQLLESSISQLLDGTRDNWGLEIAKMMEKSWLDLFSVIFVESEITSYTQLGTLVDPIQMQSCLEELQSFGKSLSYFKFDHLTRVFNIMFGYMKKNNSVEWYLGFCLQIRYYKEYCAKMIELYHYEDCFNNIVNNILTGNAHSERTGDYKDEDKTYLVEYAVLCLTKIYDQSVEIVRQEYIDNHIEDSMPINLSNTQYSEMLEKIMGSCVNIQNIVLYPRELVPLLKFLLKVFPSDEAFIDGGGLGETRQDIRHLTFIADLLFIMSRFIVELDEYNETIDSVKAVGRKIVLECTDNLLQKLIKIRFEGAATHLKEILETNDLFKMSIAQICEKAVWIPIHQEEKDYNWKSLHDYNETLQIKQDEAAVTVRGKLLEHLKILLPGASQYLSVMIDCINYALGCKIENRSNTSYEQFFNVMKRIGVHYLQSHREAQWEELLAKIYFIHSRKVKLKKMLKQWNTEFKGKMETNVNWYDQLLGENYVETEPLVLLPKVEEKPPVPISALQPQPVLNPATTITSNTPVTSTTNAVTPTTITPVTSTTSSTPSSGGLTTQTLKRRKTKLVKVEEVSSNGNNSSYPNSTNASTTTTTTAAEDDMEEDE
ncbi:hypothetical protein NAEGRDRAFT_78823 [Naegleria gruberi]|uniref:Uncharacterized protein n=1 Tax=Naegleria gruberi TaxID=5762 RepID=D2V6U4_NAEGR|nr:uncharacterized protein NAEGRDRAFT_78823 [Naegleria gruberi]EFC47506.1 hypothetical protein NAEGRDRAFT_78823 [Naegleria gruberi]|eukprot:XP_002680250.1 hypothetical protein NAEGRDRAFT_78823 [Naegleria gruberi strain NEG-M]